MRYNLDTTAPFLPQEKLFLLLNQSESYHTSDNSSQYLYLYLSTITRQSLVRLRSESKTCRRCGLSQSRCGTACPNLRRNGSCLRSQTTTHQVGSLGSGISIRRLSLWIIQTSCWSSKGIRTVRAVVGTLIRIDTSCTCSSPCDSVTES